MKTVAVFSSFLATSRLSEKSEWGTTFGLLASEDALSRMQDTLNSIYQPLQPTPAKKIGQIPDFL